MFLIADLNVRFDQDMDRARHMFDRLGEIADKAPIQVIAKGEVLHDPNIARDCDYMERWWTLTNGGVLFMEEERFRDLIERKCNPIDAHRKLFNHAIGEANLDLMLSVYDTTGVELCQELGAAIKIASSNINHHPLIVDAAAAHVPAIYMDTGRCTLAEVDVAVRLCRQCQADWSELFVAHSPDGHPAEPGDHQLRSLATLRQIFPYQAVDGIGFATHRYSQDALVMAIAMGADYIEVGVTDDKTESDQDVVTAWDLESLPKLLDALYEAEDMLGNGWRQDPATYTPKRIASSPRMGVVTREAVSIGTPLHPESMPVGYAFPQVPGQLLPEQVELWRGRPVMKNLEAGQPILWDDLVA